MYHVDGKLYLSRRMTDGKSLCLRLFLMCCNLSFRDWAKLIPADCVPVDIDIDEADNPVPPPNSLDPITAGGSITRSPARDMKERGKNNGASEEKEHGTCCGIFGCEEEEEEEKEEKWQEDIGHVLRWEAKCLGYSYLGEDELQLHNVKML